MKGRAERQTDGEPIYKLKGAAVKAGGVGGGGGGDECRKRADGTKIEIWARGPKLDPLLPDNEAP